MPDISSTSGVTRRINYSGIHDFGDAIVALSGPLYTQLAALSFEAGTEIRTSGYAARGDRGEAIYRVQGSLGGYTLDGKGVVQLANGNYAIMQPVNGGGINILAFGAVYSTATDCTVELQQAFDFQQRQLKSGFVFAPPALSLTEFICFTDCYIESGGAGIFNHRSNRSSALVTDFYGVTFKVLAGGRGFICGNRAYDVLNSVTNFILDGCHIEGTATAVSGVRLGGLSYKGAAIGVLANLSIRGFTGAAVAQPVNDKLTEETGLNDAGYYGTYGFTGACGIFISNTQRSIIYNCQIEGNYIGLGESSGGLSTTLCVIGGYNSQNLKCAIKLYTLKSATWFGNVQEGNWDEAVEVIIPNAVPIGSTAAIRSLCSQISFIGCRWEQNNLKRRDTPGLGNAYTIHIDNQTAGLYVNEFYFSPDCRLSTSYGFGVFANRSRNLRVDCRLDVYTGATALLTTNTDTWGEHDAEVQSSTSTYTTDDNFVVKRNRSKTLSNGTASVPSVGVGTIGGFYRVSGSKMGVEVGSALHSAFSDLLGYSLAQNIFGVVFGSAEDAGIFRDAAGVLKITDGTLAGGLRDAKVRNLIHDKLYSTSVAAATVPGLVTKKLEIFDGSGASLGFIPIYDAIA